uniref:glucuronosyltransferase n=1 Tax=Acrobeloides nanus TaxID=290746 RepID=A0A914DYK8_9BILA
MLPSTSAVLSLGTSISANPYILPMPPKDDEDMHNPRDFLQRLSNGVESLLENFFINFVVENFYLDSLQLFGIRDFTWHQMYKEKSGYLVDYLDKMGFPKTSSTDLFSTCSHCVTPKNLSREYEEFMNDPKSNGTIYIAFGTNVLWEHAPEPVLDAFFGAVNELDEYKVIFSFNGKPRPVKKHVMLTKWAPQVEILTHPTMKMFVSHGGLKSVKEALCSKVPVIFMPMFAEQAFNVKLMLQMGVASVINKFTITKEKIVQAVHKVCLFCID